MVKRRHQRYERIGQRHFARLTAWLVAIIVLSAAFITLAAAVGSPRHDFGVLEIGEPLRLYWWSGENRRFVVVSLRSDASSAVADYSQYTFTSIWDLGQQKGNDTLLLNKIISRTLDIPVRWYISGKRPYVTNLAWKHSLFYNWQRRFSDRRRWTEFDFTGDNWYELRKLADGTSVRVLRTTAVANALNDSFELDSIRNENLRIAVVNTTERSGLADDFAGILSNLGMYVGLVYTSTRPVNSCIVTGSAKAVHSAAAGYLADFFNCRLNETRNEKPFDLEVYLPARLFPFD